MQKFVMNYFQGRKVKVDLDSKEKKEREFSQKLPH